MNPNNRYSVAALKEAYLRGENIMAILANGDATPNSFSAIQVSYDLQAGSYTAGSKGPEGTRLRAAFAEALIPYLEGHGTILHAGIGEGVTLAPVLDRLGGAVRVYGFDASVSRLLWARRNLASHRRHEELGLFVADMAEIPLHDASADLVLSVHSIEPNGGRERELLTELLRVAARRLVLIEPSTAYASPTQKERMRRLGYCMNLPETLVKLGANITLHERWPVTSRPENQAEIIVVDVAPLKVTVGRSSEMSQGLELVAPSSLADLTPVDAGLYSMHDGLYFPIVGGFPVLTRAQAVVATQLLDGV